VTDLLGTSKLLGVPSGTGEATAAAVVQCLTEWNLQHKVVGMSFDTTASNTGASRGACTILQQQLNRTLFHFPCRHHILELVLEAAFGKCFGLSSGPDISLFKRFQTAWKSIDRTKFDPMTGDDLESSIASIFSNCNMQVVSSCTNKLQSAQPRDDYRELLELTITVLGGCPPRGFKFIRPGALHRARWMARALYGIKIFLFRKQFPLTRSELNSLKKFIPFVVTVYVPAWFSASSAVAAPAGDLKFLQNLVSYTDIDIATVTSHKFSNHLWYLSEHHAGLSLFDSCVAVDEKRKMVVALNQASKANPQSRVHLDISDKTSIANKTVADFITSTSRKFFEAFDVNMDFLEKDPTEWEDDPIFQSSLKLVSGISVINDFAERTVALIQDYNQLLTKDEQQRQFLLQVVEWHRRHFPDANKQGHRINPSTSKQ